MSVGEPLLQELITALEAALDVARQYRGSGSNNFYDIEEFCGVLEEVIAGFKAGNLMRLDDVWLWFAPTCDWDDLIGLPGFDFGNRVYELVERVKKTRGN